MASGRQSKIFAVYSFVVAGLLCISSKSDMLHHGACMINSD